MSRSQKKSRDHQFWGNIFLISFTGLVVMLFAYSVGVFPWLSLGSGLKSAESIVQIEYSGGFLAEPEAARGYDRIYPDGRVVSINRGGETMTIHTVSGEEIAALRAQIAEPGALDEAFTKKDYFCQSAFDGIDEEWRIQLQTGEVVIYSNCDHDVDFEHPFIKIVTGIIETPVE